MKINGRDFSVSEQVSKTGEKQYILTGKRGAVYGTMRNRNRPEMMFLINCRGFGIATGFDGVWLTDRDGSLEVV